MDPLTATIDKAEELLGHSPHPAIVTLPLGAMAVSNVADVLALTTGNKDFVTTAEVSMTIGLVGLAGAALTGLRDYGKIPPDREPNHQIATTHALGNMVVGSLFVASYAMRRFDRAQGRCPSVAARMLALAGGGLSLYTAWLGGKLVSELGESVQPVMEKLDEGEAPSAAGQMVLSGHQPL
jgi:uncharacterized membrane protein